MVKSEAKTPAEYLKSLPADERKVISCVRDIILKNLPKGYEETMNWGMIAYEIPLSRYPITYNKKPLMLAALAMQKNYNALHLLNTYWDSKTHEWLLREWGKSGKKLDMGKGCIRFKTLEDLPLDVIGKVIAKTSVEDYVKYYERTIAKKKNKTKK